MILPAKQRLKDELLRVIEKNLAAAEQAHRATVEAATHEEAKPENDKDTRALEQSYVARGQAQRVEELRANLTLVQRMPTHSLDEDSPIAVGALVVVEEGDRKLAFYLAVSGGGMTLSDNVQVITPQSGLGRALLGRQVGDDCEAQVAGRVRAFSVLQVV